MISTLYSNAPSTSSSLSTALDEAKKGHKPNEASSQDVLLNRLAQHIPGMDTDDIKSLDANNFTPEKVANRISDFVAQGLEAARLNGRSEDDIQKMHAAAVKGVQKGFAEAREILNSLNALSDSIATNIDITEDKTMDALSGLLTNNAPPSSAFTRISAAERYAQAETLSMTVRTQEGDQIAIHFAQASQQQTVIAAEGHQNSHAAFIDISRTEASQYLFSVDGELDNDEIDALQTLIKDVNEIANEFFNGDLQTAFERADAFKMDKTELASMNLTLTQSEQRSSVAKYQGVESFSNDMAQPNKRLGHMAHSMQNAMNAPQLSFLDNIQEATDSLLSALIEQDSRYRHANEPQKSLFDANLSSMRSLIEALPITFVREES